MSIQEEYKKSNSYLVHYRPYQGTKKEKMVAAATKWGLGDNVVLRRSAVHVKQKRCVTCVAG